MLRHKFCKGDYGEEKVDKFILSEIQAKGEISWGFICPKFLTINRFSF